MDPNLPTSVPMDVVAPELLSYVFWNNKGGVGKTTLSFHLCCRYADQHPNETVVAIDLCPQANLSMSMLGGADPEVEPNGEDRVNDVLDADRDIHGTTSVFQYFVKVCRNMTNPDPVDLFPYLTCPHTQNPSIPPNVLLLVGSQNLATVDGRLYSLSSQRDYQMDQKECWLKIHQSLRHSLELLQRSKQVRVRSFIDTNPSFSTATGTPLSCRAFLLPYMIATCLTKFIISAIGVVAADRIIIPLKADHGSRVGMKYLMSLIFGPSPLPISFAAQAHDFELQLPRVHLIVANQSKIYSQKAAGGYWAMANMARDVMWTSYLTNPACFENPGAQSLDEFSYQYLRSLQDFNTNGVLSANQGTPFYCLMEQGSAQTVGGIKLKVDKPQLQAVCEQLALIAQDLEW